MEPSSQSTPMAGLGWARMRSLGQPRPPATPPDLLPNQARKRPQRRRWLWHVLWVVVLISGLLAGGIFLLNTAHFRIHHLSIRGTANPQILAGIGALHLEGENIFLANMRQDEARIQTLPAVASASVSRSLPDTLLIQVTERQPVLIWQVGSQQLSVDASGALIAQVQAPLSLPVVIDEHPLDRSGRPFAPGGKIDPALVKMARQLLERLPREPGISRFSLRETSAYGMVVNSADGWQARFGDPQDLDTKIQMLLAILRIAQQRQQPLALVDLRFGFYPYYRLQTPAAGG
jgi:cell division protein FtsQ